MSGLGGGSNLGTATFYITGDASGATSAAAQANNSLATLESAVSRNWWGVRNLGIAFSVLPAAVGAGVAESVHYASQIQDAMVGVARTADLMGESNKAALGALQSQLEDIGRTRATPTLEIMGVAESAGALGVATDNIAAFTQTVIDFSSTTDVSSQAAATGLARLAALTGTTAGGFDNLASSIMGAGVETAATESDILAMSVRLGGLGAALGLNAHEIIGWSAAALSAGVRTAEGATQIQKTFLDITRAVSAGGHDLAAWARIAGTSGDALKEAFNASASEGLLMVVKGLGDVIATHGDFTKVLDDVGVKESRQVRVLTQLAAAQAQNANENAKASFILQTSAKYYQDLERYQAAVDARNNTFSAHLQELQNTLMQTGAALGEGLLDPLMMLLGPIQTLATGLGQIDGPAKAVLLVTTLLGAALLGVAAFAVMFGARLIIAWGAIQRLQGGLMETAGSTRALAAAQEEAEMTGIQWLAQVQKEAVALQRERDAALEAAQALAVLSGGTMTAAQIMNEAEASTVRLAASQNTASVSSEGLSKWLGRIANVGSLMMGIMVAMTTYTYALGKAQEELDNKTKAAQASNADLARVMADSGTAINDNSLNILNQNAAYQDAIQVAGRFNASQQELQDIVTSTSGKNEWVQFLGRMKDAGIQGTEEGRRTIDTLVNLRAQWKNSAGDAGVAVGAIQDTTSALHEQEEQAKATKKAYNEYRDALIQQAQASIDLVDAEMGVETANFALEDSAKSLAEAQEKVANSAHYIREAELALASARSAQDQAIRRVAEAEQNLSEARQNAADAVADAESALMDSYYSYQDQLRKIQDDEKALSDLQENSAETARKLRDATNKLADARLALRKSTMEVSDLEQNLAYLQQQGAGARDIAEAQLALAEGHQAVADAQQNVAEAEQNVADITDPVKRAEAIDKAERQLADDRRAAAKGLRDIAKNEREVADLRRDAANDTAYLDAQKDLTDAQLAVETATDQVRKAEQDLSDLRGGSLNQDLAKAQFDYEQALYKVATANVEVTKQQALANGETWDAGRAAHALADELDKLPGSYDRIAAARDRLRNAPNIPKKLADDDAASGDSALGPMEPPAGADDTVNNPNPAEKAKVGIKDILLSLLEGGGAFVVAQLLSGIVKGLVSKGPAAIGPAIAGAVAEGEAAAGAITAVSPEAAVIGAEIDAEIAAGAVEGAPVIGAGIEGGVAAGAGIAAIGIPLLIAAIVALIVVGIAALLLKDRNWQKVGDAILTGLSAALDFISNNWFDILLGLILWPLEAVNLALKAFGIDVPSMIWDGIQEGASILAGWASWLMDHIVRPIGQAGQWLINTGIAILRGLFDGLQRGFDIVDGFVRGIESRVVSAASGALSWLYNVGWDIISGLWNGLVRSWDAFYDTILSQIPNWFRNIIGNPLQYLWDVGYNLVIGLWNGLVDAWNQFWSWLTARVDDVRNLPVVSWILGSPSRLFNNYGRWLLEGLANGMKDGIGLVEDASDAMTAAVKPPVMAPIDLSAVQAQLQDFGALDPWAGAAINPAIFNAGNPTINNYHEEITIPVKTDADPSEIVNEYMWSKRVRTRG